MQILFALLKICKQRGGKIPFARVRQENHDGLARVFGSFGEFGCGPGGGTAGDTDEQSFLTTDLTGHRKRVLTLDRDDLVVNLRVQHAGHKPCADALNLVRATVPLGEHG